MSPVWNKILITVTLLHLIALKVCWVGLAVPAPGAQASFIYADKRLTADAPSLPQGDQDQEITSFIPAHSQEDNTPWRLLKQPKKDMRDVRLGL